MSPTRLLMSSASAFALGVSVSSAFAQSSSQQSTANEQPNDVRVWRAAGNRAAQPTPPRGVIRVVRPSINNPNQSAPSSFNNYTNNTPGQTPVPIVQALPQTSSGLALPQNERRPVMRSNAVRANLRSPTNQVVTREENNTAMRMTWRDATTNESGFVVQRRQAVGNAWGDAVEIVMPANSTGVMDTPGAGTFAYRVAATRTAGRSWFTDWQVVTLNAAPVQDAPAPQQLPVEAPVAQNNDPQTPAPGAAIEPPAPPVAPKLAGEVNAVDAGLRVARVAWDAATGNVTNYQIERQPAFAEGIRVLGVNDRTVNDNTGTGTFSYRVRATGPGGMSEWSNWQQVAVADIVPGTPEQLVVIDIGDHDRVRMNWRDNSDNETRFRVERQTRMGDGWGSPTSIVVASNTTQQIDAPGVGSHRYRMAAIGTAGVSSFTNWSTVTVATSPIQPSDEGNAGGNEGGGTQPLATSPPTPPIGFNVADSRDRRSQMEWQDSSDNEDAFELERSPAFAAGRVRLPSGSTSYYDPAGAGEFQYRVRSVNSAGASDWSPWVNVSVEDTVPSEPQNLNLSDQEDHNRVTLRWADASDNETTFVVEHQRQVNGAWGISRHIIILRDREEQIDSPGPGTHRYRIAAANAAGASNFSTWREITIAPDQVDPTTVAPEQPVGLTATDQQRRVGLIWTDSSENELGFEVERTPAFSSRVLLNANVTGYIDNSGVGSFAYRVRAYNNAGSSSWTGWSNIAVAETLPNPPTSLSAIDSGNQTGVNVSWIDSSFNEQDFRVERESWVSNAWAQSTVVTLSANSTNYSDAPGLGRFRYRVQATNLGGGSTWTSWAVVNVTDGWTPIVLAPGAREVFVSSSQGNDANSGLSEAQAVRTLYRGYQLLRHDSPDHLRLRRGDAWLDQNLAGQYNAWDKAGRSADEPMIIHTYGDDPARPMIRTGSKDTGIRFQGAPILNGNVWIVGIHFQANRRMPSDSNFNPAMNASGIAWYGRGGNVLVEDCVIESFGTNVQFQSPTATDIISNITFRRTQILDSYSTTNHSQGVYAVSVDGMLFDECLIDHNGWAPGITGAHGTIFNHNFYMVPSCTNVIVRNTITARASATGIQMRGRNMNAMNNLSLRNPLGITAGHAMATPEQGWTGAMRHNVVLDAGDIGNAGTSNFAPRGFGIMAHRSISGAIEHNVIAHNRSSQGGEPALTHNEMGSLDITIANNLVYDWQCAPQANDPTRGSAFRMDSVLPAGAEVRDNWFIQPDGGTLGSLGANAASPGGTWSNNKYFSINNASQGWFRTQNPAAILDAAGWAQRTNQSALPTNQRDAALSGVPSFPDPERTIETYAQSIGLAPTLEAFLAEARSQSRNNWRPELTAAAVNRYIREGFGLPEPDASQFPGAGSNVANAGE